VIFFRKVVGGRSQGAKLVASIIEALKAGSFIAQNSRQCGNSGSVRKRTGLDMSWLEQFSLRYGLPVPSSRSATKSHDAVQLPISFAKTIVYRMYGEDFTASHPGESPVSETYFFRVWRDRFPWLR
jgi:hypothetical protein